MHLLIPNICAAGSRAFGHRLKFTLSRPLDWNYTTGFFSSGAGRWEIVGFLSLYNHVTQFLYSYKNKSQSLLLYIYNIYNLLVLLPWRT